MKKILLALMVIMIFACSKKRNCSCKTTFNYAGGSETIYSNSGPIEARLTKKQAKAVCDREATAIDKTYNNWYTNNGNWQSNGVYPTTYCTLK